MFAGSGASYTFTVSPPPPGPVTGVRAADQLIQGVAATSVSGSLAGPYQFELASVPPGSVELRWSEGHDIQDLANLPNRFAGGNWSCVVDPDFVIDPVRINEILTASSGEAALLDEDDGAQDWIELWNSADQAVNFAGWSLSDDPDDPDKWTFPPLVLEAAFRAGYLPSAVATHTYIFPRQVIQQSNTPPGVPAVWIDPSGRSWTADDEMDPEITQSPLCRDQMEAALRALPVLSIVTRPEDMFDNTAGIYTRRPGIVGRLGNGPARRN